TSIQWVIIGYVLPHTSLLLVCGRLADLFGHGRLLTCGLLASAFAFFGCGFAPTFFWLIVARVAQGLTAAILSASAPALVSLAVGAEARGRALGIFQMSMAAGYAIGPLVGGVLVDLFGWRAVFLFRVAPAILLAWVAWAKLPTFQKHQDAQRFDIVGALTLAGGLAGFLLAISQSRASGWLSPQVIVPALFAALCFIGFFVTEKRVSAPVVDLSLFHRPPFFIANSLTVLAQCARFSIGLLMPYYAISVLRYPATTAGTLMLAVAIMTTFAAPAAGRLSDRFGTAGLSSLGLALEAVGLWMVSRLDAQADYISVAIALGVVGVGLGVFEAPNMSYVMGAVARSQQGVAGSIANMMRTLGIVFGATGWSMLFDARRQAYSEQLSTRTSTDLQSFVPAFQDVFLSAAGICVAAFVLSLFRKQETSASRSSDGED
ncbi:MAG TPA: MFS transporter, partial [Candidatus Limnocylindria bacterium]|nr:MFS transporter [Candidatus Limnocylindria bacterium]